MKCQFISLVEVEPHRFIAWIKRLEPHPLLGPPQDKHTNTSEIKSIDFERGIIVTQNSVYTYK